MYKIFRTAALHCIISMELCEHFITYRDHRNSTVHDYGLYFAQETLIILPQFIADSKLLVKAIQIQNDVVKD